MQHLIIINTEHPDTPLIAKQAARWVAQELSFMADRWSVRITVTEDGLETDGYVLNGEEDFPERI